MDIEPWDPKQLDSLTPAEVEAHLRDHLRVAWQMELHIDRLRREVRQAEVELEQWKRKVKRLFEGRVAASMLKEGLGERTR